MKRTATAPHTTVLSPLALVLAGLASWGCQDTGVGDPCVPEDEYRQGFGGYSKDEVNVESRSFQCETRVCLVNKFQGRVSCAYGQENANGGCITPDDLPIEVPVPAQLTARRPKDAVYCSCRCDGPQANAPYCECPEGFGCVDLIDDIGLGNKQLAGSYCVKNGTEKPSDQISDIQCSATAENCGKQGDLF